MHPVETFPRRSLFSCVGVHHPSERAFLMMPSAFGSPAGSRKAAMYREALGISCKGSQPGSLGARMTSVAWGPIEKFKKMSALEAFAGSHQPLVEVV